jgi:hypothetical protein
MNRPAYALQCLVALVLCELGARNPFGEVAFDGRNSASERFAIHIAQDNAIARGGGDLSDTMPHRACAEHGDSLKRA